MLGKEMQQLNQLVVLTIRKVFVYDLASSRALIPSWPCSWARKRGRVCAIERERQNQLRETYAKAISRFSAYKIRGQDLFEKKTRFKRDRIMFGRMFSLERGHKLSNSCNRQTHGIFCLRYDWLVATKEQPVL